MRLIDENNDGSFGKFYGHPNGNNASRQMVIRLLEEFNLTFQNFRQIVVNTIVPETITHITNLQQPFQLQFTSNNWINQPQYPESTYTADFGLCINNRWIFVEIELSDIRRAVNAFFMDRVFRTAYMRLGIFIAPEHNRLEKKRFYSQLTRRYNYIAPDYPLWVIGFDLDTQVG